MYDKNLDEESLKLRIYEDIFTDSKPGKTLRYSTLGKIDFAISYYQCSLYDGIYFLWAEAKRGRDKDIIESFIQLILTIGKEQSYDGQLPPAFLGALDCEKIAFIEYHEIQHIFSQNDFNWNVAPSNHESKEFKQLYSELKSLLDSKKMLFYYSQDSAQLKEFIESNFRIDNPHLQKIRINKNNFIEIFQRWLEVVKPSISIDWNLAKSAGIIDADFYLADILSKDNQTLIDKLFVVLKKTQYEFNKKTTSIGSLVSESATFRDNRKKHTEFWNLYERPPLEQYWEYIIERRDLLVSRDIRERKGAFFTPQIWAYKAQDYLAKALGENYQNNYYIWDLAAGTGNLLINIINPRNVFASTIDKSDVKIMQELAKSKSLNLLQNHIFQFDFLNDNFFDKIDSKGNVVIESKLPKNLQEILKDSNERKKLIIFINPPYAEASSGGTPTGHAKNKPNVATNKIGKKYINTLGKGNRELFAQFFIRIYKEIEGCILAAFSKLKYINSSNFIKFRRTFKAKFLKGFVCPAYTFDNVKGEFPIGFLIWNLNIKDSIKSVKLDVFTTDIKIKLEEAKLRNKKVEILREGKKKINAILDNKQKSINKWIVKFRYSNDNILAWLCTGAPDTQHTKYTHLFNFKGIINTPYIAINEYNLIVCSVYFAVRHCIKHTWLNDRDQFLAPNDKWKIDSNFSNDCLAFMLFSSQNRVVSKYFERNVSKNYYIDSSFINHFIPFSEVEIGSKEAFKSDFMYRFLQGKIKADSIESSGATYKKSKLIKVDSKIESFIPTKPLEFSPEARAVFNAGREIFKYYHAQDFSNLAFHYDDGYDRIYNPNASLYDIKAHFQGFSLDSKGNATKMNPLQKCLDSNYANLANALNIALDALALNIESKVYEYEFLIE